jgi:hypothetical protein
MTVLGTGNIYMPKNLAAGIWAKATKGSVVAQLSGREPMKFGQTDIMTFNGVPRAEYVGEGANKASSSGTFGTQSITPKKAQVTVRFNEEVQWADEDYQLGVLAELGDSLSLALSRALDFGVIHRISPLTGAATAVITAGTQINATTQRVEAVTASTADTEVETAAGLVIASGYVPSGIAFDPKYAWSLATARYSDGRKKFPELGLGTNIQAFAGLNAAVSDTVSGTPEATDTKLRAIIGQWNLLRWGVQRQIPVQTIAYGDPDGQGDLKRSNQIALRAEVVYGWVTMDLNGFAAINDLV